MRRGNLVNHELEELLSNPETPLRKILEQSNVKSALMMPTENCKK